MDFKKILIKFSSSKNKANIIILIGFLGIFLIAFSSFRHKFKNAKNSAKTTSSIKSASSIEEYTNILESKIKKMVSQIEGAGSCDVTITMERGVENVYANSEKKTQNHGENLSGKPSIQDNVQRDVVVIDDSGGKHALMVTQKEPIVKGIVIVCEGANNPAVAKQIHDAASKALATPANRISVVKGSSKMLNNKQNNIKN